MAFLDTTYKRKSAVLTAIIAALMVLFLFLFGLKYYDPPLEFGIAVNFGTSDDGSGDVQPAEELMPMQEQVTSTEENIPETQPETAEIESVAEEVVTQDNEDAIAIKKQKEAKLKQDADNKIKLEKERADKAKKDAADKTRKEQEAKKQQLDALMGGLNSKGKATGGEGDGKVAGDKGKTTGDPNAKGYYGSGGDGGGNYRLGNRQAVSKPKPLYECNEEGNVYVSIAVDKGGNVVSAQAGVKGTTNTAPCLLESAKAAALKTKFSPDDTAPAKQIGTIIYNFSLSE
ncbi:MAG: energy transducer TonB [Flavobacteriaceae bacterium]|nr:energy transducer TonB [Flavobacteriaceae bacterium]